MDLSLQRSPSCSGRAPRSRTPSVAVHARFGRDSGLIIGPNSPNSGNNSNNNIQRGKDARPGLIVPGQTRPGQGGGRIVIPDKQGQSKGPGGGSTGSSGQYLPDDSTLGLVSDTLVGGPATLNKYRPPAGFMNESLPEDAYNDMDPQQMINKLRSRAGHWYDLAKLMPPLNSSGYTSSVIDELTGITPLEQSKWVVAATVYESVKASQAVPPDVLSRFDGDGVDLLYPFRFLGAERRVDAAMYIVEKNLDATTCDLLAREMKEYERRVTERVGFTEHPGDCLAFKCLRDAIECRKRKAALQKVDEGLRVAHSDGAKQRLMELLEEAPDEVATGSVAATLVSLRLEPEELGVRPVCVLGELGQATVDDLQAAPRTKQSGAFGVFTVEPYTPPASNARTGGANAPTNWVALPLWRALAMARHPVAFTIKDCSAVQAVVTGSKSKTDEDRKRLQGAGMLVVDKAPGAFEELDENAWYLAHVEGFRALQMVDGRRAAELAARGSLYGVVLFLARPPIKETADRGTSLLQV